MGIKSVDLDELGDGPEGEKGKPETKREREQRRTGEKGLNDRLRACFDRIADALADRGDEELAEIVREDAAVMAGGLMSLTSPFKPVRTLVVLFVSVIEPALAFGRILRVLVGRWAERRAAAVAEREAQEQAGPQPPPEFVT